MVTRIARLLARPLAAALAATALPLVAPGPAAAAEASSVIDYGTAPALGAPTGPLAAPMIGIAAHPTRPGYWLLGRDGGVFTHGSARFHGSTGARALNRPVVAMAATPSGNGYYLAAEDGGVFTFGDATFHGSTGALDLARPIVGIAVHPEGRGYWLVASDGGVFAFGRARYHGGTAGTWTGTPITALVPSRSGRGYVLVGADGQVFSFGDAPRYASQAFVPAGGSPIVGAETTRSGRGLWLVARDGAVFTYGDAGYLGGANDRPANAIGLARTPGGRGYWIALGATGPPAPPGSGQGRRIVYSNSMQRVWLVEASEVVAHTFLVSGRRGVPNPGTYHIYSKSPVSYSGSLRLPWMSRFYLASTGRAVGFHGIPLRSNGSPIQTDAELGQYRSHGCVRMNQQAVKVLYDWAPIGTPVVVLP